MDSAIRQERLTRHDVYTQYRGCSCWAYLNDVRNNRHFLWTMAGLGREQGNTLLDVGCYNGWLDFCIMAALPMIKCTGVEVSPLLCKSSHEYAAANGIKWNVYTGFFDELVIPGHYDVCSMYEVLEHMPMETAIACTDKAAQLASRVMISLPNQDYHDNPDHLWTPTEELIRDTWGSKPHFEMERWKYPGTTIPDNWACTWRAE